MSIVLDCNFEDSSVEFENFISYQNALKGLLIINSCTIKDEESLSKCLNDLKDKLSVYNYVDYDMSSDDTKYIVLSSENFTIYLRTNTLKLITVKIYASNYKICKEIYDICIKYEESFKGSKDLYLFEYHLVNNDISYKFNVYRDNNYVKEYYYPYLNTSNLIDSYLRAKENILVITGKSGIGKSKFASLMIKYIKDHYDEYVKANDSLSNIAFVNHADTLLSDSFWLSIIDENIGLVVIDDLEYLLSSRENGVETHDDVKRNAFLSKFLSFTDGIDSPNIKFVITTNQSYKQFDKALIRKGRMFDVLKFRDLSKKEALNIWKYEELNERDFPFNEDTVLQCDLDSEIYLRKHNIDKAYMLEKQQSIIKEVKKLGL